MTQGDKMVTIKSRVLEAVEKNPGVHPYLVWSRSFQFEGVSWSYFSGIIRRHERSSSRERIFEKTSAADPLSPAEVVSQALWETCHPVGSWVLAESLGGPTPFERDRASRAASRVVVALKKEGFLV